MFDGRRLCLVDERAACEAAAAAAAAARLTIDRFLALAEAAGNPGVRYWDIGESRTVQRKAGRTWLGTAQTVEESNWVSRYRIGGWPLGRGEVVLTTDGRVHYASWDGGFRDYCEWYNWGNVSSLGTEKIHFDWGSKDGPPSEEFDVSLRQLCFELGLTP